MMDKMVSLGIMLERGDWELPTRIVLHSEPLWTPFIDVFRQHVEDMAKQLPGVTLTYEKLPVIQPYLFSARVNDWLVGFDFCDLADAHHLGHFHYVFKQACMSCHEHYLRVASWPNIAFKSWSQYLELSARPSGFINAINYRDVINDREGLVSRRTRVREILKEAFGDRVHTDIVFQRQYLDAVRDYAVTVHVGGGFNNRTDRTSMQTMALGGCLVQPTIFTLVGDQRPRPGVHYFDCWDDYSDLVETVRWVLEHREERDKVAAQAKAFYRQECCPEAFWGRIVRCCTQGR